MKTDDREGVRDSARREFILRAGAVGAGFLYTITGLARAQEGRPGEAAGSKGFSFVQISDTHIGFDNPPNRNVAATLEEVIEKVNALPEPPDFVMHTGDLSNLSKPEEFDGLDRLLSQMKVRSIRYIPGEHDVIGDDGKLFFSRYAPGAEKGGWFSFDNRGVHFVALVNVLDRPQTGAGHLGADQLSWVKRDLDAVSRGTPIVVFAHIPLWNVYPAWGWNTEDAEPLIAQLREFESVTVLNGHIHQIQQTAERSMTFQTARSTAYPQPRPGAPPGHPGPLPVREGDLRSYLGFRTVDAGRAFMVADVALAPPPAGGRAEPAQTEAPDSGRTAAAGKGGPTAGVEIRKFHFVPQTLTVAPGTTVRWTNRDEEAHTVMSADKSFNQTPAALDTDESYSHTFDKPGEYPYFCSIHPQMRGTIIVR